MASLINASTSPAGIVQTADGTANLSLQSNGTTIAALTSTGMAVTGTLSASGVITATGGVVVGATAAPAFAARRTTNQSLTSATYTKVQLATEDFDTANCFDSTTNYRFTPNVAGYYQINTSMNLEPSSGSGTIFIGLIYKNGLEFLRAWDNRASAILNNSSGSILMYFNGTTDYIELYAYTQGTTPVITVAYLNGCLVRSA